MREEVNTGNIRKNYRFLGVEVGNVTILLNYFESHNHDLKNTLVGHPYVGRFTSIEKSILMNMIDNIVKPRNILLTMKEHIKKNGTIIKQVYNAQYMYRNSK